MDIKQLLNGHECACGKRHTCEIKCVETGKGAINTLPGLCKDYSKILVVCDKNTYDVCGEKAQELLGDKIYHTQIFTCDGFLVPDEKSIEKVQSVLSPDADLIIGIGSGVINDLCKYVSFNAHLPYYIVATAPSMDGYASTGAAMIIGNMKVTYSASVPTAIIADTDILVTAPEDMIRSGYGDIIGKYSCLNDWKLSALINGEYLCGYIYDMTYKTAEKVKKLSKKLLERDPQSIEALMEALIIVGVAMSYMGNSRPASGSEHHLSHFFEIHGLLCGEEYFCHGIDVAYSSYITQKLREEIIRKDKLEKKTFDEVLWEKETRRVYTKAADGVISLQKKLGDIYKDRSYLYAERGSEIKRVLAETPSSDEFEEMLEDIGLPVSRFYEMYSEDKIKLAIKHAKDLKDRYTVLDLYNDIV